LGLRLEQLESRVVLSTPTSTWTGADVATSSNWSDGKNWQGNTVPAAGNDLVFPSGPTGPAQVSNDDLGDRGFGSLSIQASAYTISVTNPVTLKLSGTIDASQASGSSDVSVPVDFGTNAATVKVDNSAATLVLAGAISGSNGLTKQGSGELDLNSTNNTYTGTTTVAAGTLRVAGTVGPVAAESGSTVGGTGTVGSITTTAATLSPGGSSAPGTLTDAGALTLDSGSTYQVRLNSDTVFSQTQAAGPINLGGAALSLTLNFTPTTRDTFTIIKNNSGSPVTGTFAGLPEGGIVTSSGQRYRIDYNSGSGHDVVLTRALTETWTGADAATSDNWSDDKNWQGNTHLMAGDNLVFPSGLTGAAKTSHNDLPAGTSFGSLAVQDSGYAIGGNQVALTGPISATQNLGSSTVSLPIDFGTTTGTVSIPTSGATLVLSGVLAGSGGLAMQGIGELDLTASNTYTGTTTVTSGLLRVNGTVGPVIASSGSTLGGIGTVGSITTNTATLSPGGAAPGTLTDSGILMFDPASTYAVTLDSDTSYGQVQAGGTITLSSATLSTTLGFTPTGNDQFTIIKNNSSTPVVGTFLGLAEGAIVTASGQQFRISYKGGAGNDVVLTHVITTTTTVTASPPSPTYGQPVTFTATIAPASSGASPPTGSVTFTDTLSNTTIGTAQVNPNGTATLTTSTLSAASYSITAAYAGDSNYAASMSTALSLTIGQAAEVTTLKSSPNPSTFGQMVTLTAQVAPVSPAVTTPTGTITFMNGSTTLGSAALANGVATLTTAALPIGSDGVSATYSGDTNFAAGPGATLTQQVGLGRPTIALTASNLNPFPIDSVALTASVGVPAGATAATGQVTFFGPDGINLGSSALSNGTATLVVSGLPVGSLPVTALYSGDSNYGGVTSSALMLVVGSANQRYVDQVYQAAFGLSAGIGVGIDYWTDLLNAGYPRSAIVNQIVHAPGSRGQAVQQVYQLVLGRAATPAEVSRARDLPFSQVEAQVFGSREFYVTQGGGTVDGFLTALAQDLTGSAFPAGLQARYARQIRQGTSRSQVALEVINSPRGIRAQIEDVYQRVLGTPATRQGLARFTPFLQQGGQIPQVIDALLVTEAFFKKATAT
jgi:autotransporter-associated beta strand protein